MTPEQLLKGENDVDEELARIATVEKAVHEPITDGVVDACRYLTARPRILWILKEPWELLEKGEVGGGWSVTKDVAAKLKSNKGALPMIAFISFSVFNAGLSWEQVPWVTDDSKVGEALNRIAIININKYPGPTRSSDGQIAAYYEKNQDLLQKQIALYNPDIIIGGSTLHLFFEKLRLQWDLFNKDKSAWFCKHNGTLFIAAYHPAQWSAVPRPQYFKDIVDIIRANFFAASGQ